MRSCRNKLTTMSASRRLPKSWPWMAESIKSFCFVFSGNDVRRRHRVIAVSGQGKPPANGERSNRMERGKRMASGFAYSAIGLLAVVCYTSCLAGDFVHDDLMAIVKNPDVRTDSSIVELWTHDFWGQKMSSNLSHKSYRPLTVLTFRFNFYFSGLNPFGYHVTNVLLHALATVLFMYLCRHVIELDSRMSALAAAMFAVHPIHTEAVAGIVGRADVLSCIFFHISIILYVRSGFETERKRTSQMFQLLGSLLSAVCATLSKETGCSAYLVCLTYDLTLLFKLERRKTKKKNASDRSGIVLRLTATITTLITVLFFRCWIMHWTLPIFTVDDNPASFHPRWSVRLMSYLHIISLTIWLTVNPSSLSYDWTMGSLPLVHSITDVRNIFTILIVVATFAGTTLIVFKSNSNNTSINKRPFIFGYTMMVLSYLPTTNLFYRVGYVIAERLLYTSSCGYIVLLVASLERIHLRMPRCRVSIYACVAMLLTSHAARTIIRNKVWINRESLFRSGVESQLSNGKFYYNYGNLMRDRGQVDQAISFYREAIRLWPTYASAKNNLGTIVSDETEAEVLYRQALVDQPCHSNALFNLGNLLSHRGDYDGAIVNLWGAAQCDPSSSLPHSSLAAIHRYLRNTHLAEWHYLKAIRLTPEKANVYYNYASYLRERGRHSSARHYCQILSEITGRHFRWNLESCKGNDYSCNTVSSHYFDQQLHRVCDNPESLDTTRRQLPMSVFDKRSSSNPHKTSDQDDRGSVVGLSEAEIRLMTIKQRSDALGNSGHHKQATVFLEQWFERNILLSDHKALGLVHYELARHLQDSGMEENAFLHYRKAVENNPLLSDANHRVAIFYHLKGCVDKAKEFYIRSLHLDPENKLVAENLGKLIRTQKTVESRNIISNRGTSQDFNKMASDTQNGDRNFQRSNLSSFSKTEGMIKRQEDLSTNEYTISNTKQISRDGGAITETVVFR